MSRVGLLSVVLAACSADPPGLEIRLRTPDDPRLLDGVQTFLFSVEDAQSRPLVLLSAPPGRLVLDEIPYGPALTFQLQGLFQSTPLVIGRSCPTDVLADRPLPEVSLMLSRAGSFAPAADPASEREGAVAFVRDDGQVVIAGGTDREGRALDTAQRFDPRSGVWAPERALRRPRRAGAVAHAADGQVLVIGGLGPDGPCPPEVYRPAEGFVALTPDLAFGGDGVRATTLSDGRVLVSGGAAGTEPARSAMAIFDRGEILPLGTLRVPRRRHTVSAVGSGPFSAAFVIGGDGGSDLPALAEIEIINPRAAAGVPVASLAGRLLQPRADHTATVLASGEILVVGGSAAGQPLASAEIVDPITRTVVDAGRLGRARTGHAATLLRDGRVLITGGVGEGGQKLPSAEIFDPTFRAFAAAQPLASPRADHAAVELCDGTVLVVGGGPGAEIYNPSR